MSNCNRNRLISVEAIPHRRRGAEPCRARGAHMCRVEMSHRMVLMCLFSRVVYARRERAAPHHFVAHKTHTATIAPGGAGARDGRAHAARPF